MDLELEKENYCYLKKCYEGAIEETAEAELALPEYMPEILRIIKSAAVPKINSCQTVGERLTVDGSCELRMIYAAADGGIYSFSQSRSFTRYVENSALSGADDVTVKPSVTYVNCRATSPKRAEIKAGLSLSATAFSGVKAEMLCVGNGQGIESRTESLSASSLGCRKSRSFCLSDTFEISGGAAACIISSAAFAVPNDVRKISNKLMIKGEATIEISYVPVSDRTSVEQIKHTLPINQILEFDGMEESFEGDVTLEVTSADVILKSDSSGDGRMFDISLGVVATATMWEEKELVLITDAYSVEQPLSLSHGTVHTYSRLAGLNENFVCKDSYDVSSVGVSSILDMCYESGMPAMTYADGTFAVVGSLKVSLLLRDTSGNVVTGEKMVDYRYEKALACENGTVWCVPNVTVTNFDCILKNRDEIDFRVELTVCCSVFAEQEKECVTSIEASNETSAVRSSALMIYFPDKEESLWTIARRYNTTVAAISEENGLTGETSGENTMLFIPTM